MTTNNKIDLRTCVPGQVVERRDGTLVTYESKFKCSTDYPHLVEGESYTNDGYYRVSKTEDDWDIVKIFPVKKSESEIDLNTCVPGQKVKLRDKTICIYNGLIDENKLYTHAVDSYSYTSNGSFWDDGRTSNKDVIEILPMGDKPVTDLRTCVSGQKLRLRDGRITTYKRTTGSPEYPHQFYSGGTCTDEGYYWLDKARSDGDVMEILPMEEEPAKTPPELTHSITDQIDVTSPDHVSIIPNENGVTISIKKGKTTINWRHSNN